MKRLIILLALFLFAAAGCKEKKPADYTRLGFYTPYQTYMEKLNDKVESVIEKGYWAIPEGDTYVKGARITKKELDSIGYTYDFKAIFDSEGDLVTTTTYDENERMIDSWSFTKENNRPVRAEYTVDDTLRFYTRITCDEEGNPYQYEAYDALTDTLTRKDVVSGFETNDTTIWQSHNYAGEPGSKYMFVFNDLGLLTNFEIYRKDGTPGSSYTLTYNEKGVQSEYTSFDKDKIMNGKTTSSYEYDERGNWIKVICKDQRGFTVISERVYTYFE